MKIPNTFKIISDSGWSMEIYIDLFFPCSQRNLLKVFKLIKESVDLHSKYIAELQVLYQYVSSYHYALAPESENEKLNRNQALIRKAIIEALLGKNE